MNIHFIFIFLSALTLSSCTELTGESTGANVIENNQELIGGIEAVKADGSKFLLNGTVDNGGNSGHGHRLKFNLPEGETLTFYFFITKGFEGGVEYTFTRSQGIVNLKMDINGITHDIDLDDFSDSEVIDLDLDIHNDHTDIHLLIWDKNGPHEFYEECSYDGGCLYNSEDFAFDIWLGVGRASGTFWGIQGNKSLIIKLEGPNPPLTDV